MTAAPSMEEILADLADEAAALDSLLAGLPDETWLRPTPARAWDVRDTVSHLADTDDVAFDCVTGGTRDLSRDVTAAGGGDAFTQMQVDKGRAMPPRKVLAWWRASNARLRDALAERDAHDRIPWGPNKIGAASFATARLMETWAHGLDCFAASEVEPVDTDRLRHVAFLGLRALPYAFGMQKLPPPGPVRLDLLSPACAEWTFGPPDAPTVIGGSASDWCRVATQRDRSDERSRLRGRGPDAEGVLRYARAYL